MVFEPDIYSESLTVMENIIVEARHEFMIKIGGKIEGESGKKLVRREPLPVSWAAFGRSFGAIFVDAVQKRHFVYTRDIPKVTVCSIFGLYFVNVALIGVYQSTARLLRNMLALSFVGFDEQFRL